MSEEFRGIGRLGQVSMRAKNLERAVTFYRDVLGAKFLFTAPPRMAFFDLDGVRLLLGEPEPGFDHPGSILYFTVGNIQSAHDVLAKRGVTFAHDPAMIADMGDHELWMASFMDSEDNHLALMCEVPKP